MTGSEGNIDKLAQESTHQAKRQWLPAVPLTLLAPLLVAIALIGVLIPVMFSRCLVPIVLHAAAYLSEPQNTVILTGASDETATYISGKYFESVISNVAFRAQSRIESFLPVVNTATNLPDLNDAFTGPFSGLQNAPHVPEQLAILREQNNLDVLVCTAARWMPGYNEQVATICKADLDMQSIYNPMSGQNGLGVVDDDLKFQPNGLIMRAYALDPITRRVADPTFYNVTPYVDYTPIVKMMLGTMKTIAYPFFVINQSTASGLRVAFIGKTHIAPGGTRPSFGCSAGLSVDNTWIAMLRSLKPVEDSIVAMLELEQTLVPSTNFTILASSRWSEGPVTMDQYNSPKYNRPTEDATTGVLRLAVKERFPTMQLASDAGQARVSFEHDMDGKRYITMLGIAKLAQNYRLLVVVSLPRGELSSTCYYIIIAQIYGRIDAASSRSRATSIGIAVGVTTAIAAIFVLAVLPLFNLAKQMEELTKLNFGTLETSGALDKRSWVWELRKVQIVFGTMVKAFAGAIKKNKSMHQRPATNSANSNANVKRTSAAVKLVEKANDDKADMV
ncbi:hypothetical protein HDU86_001318 [Geranomyces michiganensis]|nr:hypothetical protein HDU86_001318 [Geranomyces michiganensis]